jgi:N utilization substance protein B
MGSRRRARESALQVLFGLDWVTVPAEVAMDEYWTRFAGERPASYEDVRRHCVELVHGVLDNKTAIDAKVQGASHHWKLDRMSAVDRNILRLATYEILLLGERVPRKVAINEAIEIAKKFGNEDSGAFVNGILDRIAQDLTRTEKPRRGPGKEGKEAKAAMPAPQVATVQVSPAPDESEDEEA